MPLRPPPPLRFIQRTPRCLYHRETPMPLSLPSLRAVHTTPIRNGILSKASPKKTYPKVDSITLHRIVERRNAYYKRRMKISAFGAVSGMLAILLTVLYYPMPPPTDGEEEGKKLSMIEKMRTRLDGETKRDDPLVVLGRERKVVVQKLGEEPEVRADTVSTGSNTVPEFPRVLEFADTEAGIDGKGSDVTEYQLLGLGVRTVSFLGIQVYVVGIYIATDDIARLQNWLIKKVNSGASTLVAGEKDTLRQMLRDPEQGVEIWEEVLVKGGLRTLVRIVPTRNTDFGHLRDAWVRALTARAQRDGATFGDEQFGLSVGEFKKLFNRGSVPKGKELLLSRDGRGRLAVWYDNGKSAQRLGDVRDERISRVVWMGYLAGKNVASEKARESVIEGIVEFVERPVGTVATQVHSHL